MAELLIRIGAQVFATLLISGIALLFATPAIRVISFLTMIVGGSIGAWLLAGTTGSIVCFVIALIGLLGLVLNGIAEKRRASSRWRIQNR